MPKLTGRAIAAITALTLLVAACGSTSPATSSPSVPSSVAPPVATAPPITSAPAPTQAPTARPVASPTTVATRTASAAPISPAPATPGPGTGGLLPTDPELLGTGLVPEGWQVVEDITGACRIAVPGDWTVGIEPGAGQSSALAQARAEVSADTQEWEAYKQAVNQAHLPGHVTLIDTSDVFLISNPIGIAFDVGYVLGLRSDDVNCQLLATAQRSSIPQYAPAAILISQTLDHTD